MTPRPRRCPECDNLSPNDLYCEDCGASLENAEVEADDTERLRMPDTQSEESRSGGLRPPEMFGYDHSASGSSGPQDVVVRDIQMGFGSMVEFMVKWAIATIPALIILTLIGWAIAAFLLGLGGAAF